ncbi:MAG: hypothetical protein GY845_19395 [Planctomycetes bacterium]|nr:hypothetical protein [Planctomycetota bacterium]
MFIRIFANCICLLVMATLLSGCSSCFQQPEVDANYSSLPVNYDLTIKEYFEDVLIDAESARYEFSQPVEAYENEGLLAGGEVDRGKTLVTIANSEAKPAQADDSLYGRE